MPSKVLKSTGEKSFKHSSKSDGKSAPSPPATPKKAGKSKPKGKSKTKIPTKEAAAKDMMPDKVESAAIAIDLDEDEVTSFVEQDGHVPMSRHAHVYTRTCAQASVPTWAYPCV